MTIDYILIPAILGILFVYLGFDRLFGRPRKPFTCPLCMGFYFGVVGFIAHTLKAGDTLSSAFVFFDAIGNGLKSGIISLFLYNLLLHLEE